MAAHFNRFVFLFIMNCKHIDKQNSCSSLSRRFLRIKIFGMRIKLFALEIIEIKDARTRNKLMKVNLNSWNFVFCSPSYI